MLSAKLCLAQRAFLGSVGIEVTLRSSSRKGADVSLVPGEAVSAAILDEEPRGAAHQIWGPWVFLVRVLR